MMQKIKSKEFKLNFNKSGFSLIELLVVVSILGILAATAVASYRGHQVKIGILKMYNMLNVIAANIVEYKQKTGNFPASIKYPADSSKTITSNLWTYVDDNSSNIQSVWYNPQSSNSVAIQVAPTDSFRNTIPTALGSAPLILTVTINNNSVSYVCSVLNGVSIGYDYVPVNCRNSSYPL